MYVLLVHNRYQSQAPSGEDMVFMEEKALLENRGHQVIVFERHNDEIESFSPWQKAFLLWRTAWSFQAYEQIRKIVRSEKPDIVHFHNTFPLITPAAYYACQDEKVPVVQTLHNFRLFCPAGVFLRDGQICEECLEHGPWRGVRYRCYRGSWIQTVPVAGMIWLHQHKMTWDRQVDVYIALTEFGRRKFIQGKLPPDRIVVKPNFLSNPLEPCFDHQGFVLFLGRLTPEKGVRTLLTAWRKLKDISLNIIGDGSSRPELERIAQRNDLSGVEFIGRLPRNESFEWLKRAHFLIMPSECYETFGLPIIEAFACGKPVVASRLGAMAAIIEDGKTGLLFEPGNPDDLAAKVRWLVENENIVIKMGRAARAEFEAKYTAERNYEMLMEIYEMAIRVHRERKR